MNGGRCESLERKQRCGNCYASMLLSSCVREGVSGVCLNLHDSIFSICINAYIISFFFDITSWRNCAGT